MRFDSSRQQNEKDEKEEKEEECRRCDENSEMPGLEWVDGRSCDRGGGKKRRFMMVR